MRVHDDCNVTCKLRRAFWLQHWVPLEGLYRTMQRADTVTGRPRGFLRMGAQPRLDSVLFTLRRCGRYALTCKAKRGKHCCEGLAGTLSFLSQSRKLTEC